jgi:ATP-binding cassette, subfamily B, bacterial PglK
LKDSIKKIVRVLPSSCRRLAAFVGVMMVLNAILELTGVAGIWPLMLAAIDPSKVETNPFLSTLQQASGLTEHSQFLFFLMCLFVGLIALLNTCGAATLWISVYFSQQVRHHMSRELLKAYLEKPYIWYLSRNTSALTKDVLTEVDQLSQFLVFRFVEILTKGIAAGLIFIGLVILEPYLALGTILILTLLYSQIFRFFRTRLRVVGEERHLVAEERFKLVTEALSSIKEAKAFDRRAGVLSQYDALSIRHRDVSVTNQLISELPRFLTETIAIAAILGAMVYLTLHYSSAAFPLTTVYIMATFRLVPAAQKAYKNAVDIKYYLPALDAVYAELIQPPQLGWLIGDEPPLDFEREVRLEGVSFTYPGSDTPALCDIDLVIPKNTSVALIGRTGGGKTTLADVIAGHFEPQNGSLTVDGVELDAQLLASWRSLVGTVPQEIFLMDDTVRRNIALGGNRKEVDQDALEAAARHASIHEFIVNELPEGYDTVLGERGVSLSGGQRQRLGIARALYSDPPFLVLDEATNALDNLTERSVLDAISGLSESKTLLVIAHRLSTIKACHQVCFLKDGRIRAVGTFSELEANLPELKALIEAEGMRE